MVRNAFQCVGTNMRRQPAECKWLQERQRRVPGQTSDVVQKDLVAVEKYFETSSKPDQTSALQEAARF